MHFITALTRHGHCKQYQYDYKAGISFILKLSQISVKGSELIEAMLTSNQQMGLLALNHIF